MAELSSRRRRCRGRPYLIAAAALLLAGSVSSMPARNGEYCVTSPGDVEVDVCRENNGSLRPREFGRLRHCVSDPGTVSIRTDRKTRFLLLFHMSFSTDVLRGKIRYGRT